MYEILELAVKGEEVKEQKYEEMVNETTLELIDTYDIYFDHENLVPSDFKMADRIYAAAIELIIKVGIFCTDTKKIIKIENEDINKILHNTRSSYNFGRDMDSFPLNFRNVGEKSMPAIMGGPAGTLISPELFIPIHRSYAKCYSINGIAPGALTGETPPHLKNTPAEIFETHKAIDLLSEACALENRSGIGSFSPPCISGINSALSISNRKYIKQGNFHEICQPPGLKTSFNSISQAIHCTDMEIPYHCDQTMILEDTSPYSTEQEVIKIVAEAIKSKVILSSHIYFKFPIHWKTKASSNLYTLWPSFMASMAISRNTKYLHGSNITNSAGPCTSMMMYETAVQTIGNVICGTDLISGPIPNAGYALDHAGGLDAEFMSNIADLATMLSIDDANYLCLELYSRYMDKLNKPDYGKAFSECYDLKKIEPSREYNEVYESVMGDIYDLMG